MKTGSSLHWTDLFWFLLVVALAGGVRFWYLFDCVDQAAAAQPPYLAQAPAAPLEPGAGTILGKQEPSEQDQLIANLRDNNWFASRAPFSLQEEDTAHVAPGYPWLVALVYRFAGEQDAVPLIRWGQCGLGVLTAGIYFLFARLAFGSLAVALLTGLFCAVNPFWVINTAQVQDGVLTSMLLACSLLFGTRAAKSGDAFASLLFGLSLAGLSLVRAALFPFAVVALLWFLRRGREVPRGWFPALLAVLGFVNGVAPWAVRNYQTFGAVIPVADSAWLHLWMGNNPKATGAEMDRVQLIYAFDGNAELLTQLRQEPAQHHRYQLLAADTVQFVREHPDQALKNRILAGQYFLLGRDWFTQETPGDNKVAGSSVPGWLRNNFEVIVNGTLLAMLLLALLGWRWTHHWHGDTGLATLALLWVPLPYLLSHAESLWGPRLPLDGVLLCYAAFAVVYLLPGFGSRLVQGPQTAGA